MPPRPIRPTISCRSRGRGPCGITGSGSSASTVCAAGPWSPSSVTQAALSFSLRSLRSLRCSSVSLPPNDGSLGQSPHSTRPAVFAFADIRRLAQSDDIPKSLCLRTMPTGRSEHQHQDVLRYATRFRAFITSSVARPCRRDPIDDWVEMTAHGRKACTGPRMDIIGR